MDLISPAPSSSNASPPTPGIPLTRSLAALVLRVVLGLTILLFHGIPEARLGWANVWRGESWPLVDYVRMLSVPFAEFVTPAMIVLGLASTAAVIIGLLTRIASTVLLGIAVVATVELLRPPGAPLAEAAIAYAAGFAALVILGSGIFSLDAILSRKPPKPKRRPLA